MTIEVKELVIKMVIEKPLKKTSDKSNPTKHLLSNDVLIQQCVSKVIAILDERKER